MGGDGGGGVPPRRTPDRHPRPEPPGPARRHDARLARRRVRATARRRSAGGAIEIDGHDVDAIDRAYADAEAADRPTLIVARTEKGHGVSFLADQEGWHGKAVPADRPRQAIAELGGPRDVHVAAAGAARLQARGSSASCGRRRLPPTTGPSPRARRSARPSPGSRATAPSSWSWTARSGTPPTPRTSQAVAPERFIQMYIAEQCMVGVQTGLQALGKTAFAARSAPSSRARYDRPDGRHQPGRTSGSAGRTPACRSARTAPRRWRSRTSRCSARSDGSTVLYPADGNSHGEARHGDVRPRRDLLPAHDAGGDARRSTDPTRSSRSAGRRRSPSSDHDDVHAGRRRHHAARCLAAADGSAREGIPARVIDAYSVKPIDAHDAPHARSTQTEAASWSSRTIASRAASATRCSTRSRRRVRCTGAS